ncbi:unnamed protein product [Amoebophrya sp. A25]|nr:unnamed protein product [Amoebophrya sp. A25]|eukprot:GSA25T00025899001.1
MLPAFVSGVLPYSANLFFSCLSTVFGWRRDYTPDSRVVTSSGPEENMLVELCAQLLVVALDQTDDADKDDEANHMSPYQPHYSSSDEEEEEDSGSISSSDEDQSSGTVSREIAYANGGEQTTIISSSTSATNSKRTVGEASAGDVESASTATTGAAGAATSSSSRKKSKQSRKSNVVPQPNLFRQLLRSISKTGDLDFIIDGYLRLFEHSRRGHLRPARAGCGSLLFALSSCSTVSSSPTTSTAGEAVSSSSSMLGNMLSSSSSSTSAFASLERCDALLLLLLWQMLSANEHLMPRIAARGKSNAFIFFLLQVAAAANARKVDSFADLHLCSFLLLRFSGNRAVAVALNQQCGTLAEQYEDPTSAGSGGVASIFSRLLTASDSTSSSQSGGAGDDNGAPPATIAIVLRSTFGDSLAARKNLSCGDVLIMLIYRMVSDAVSSRDDALVDLLLTALCNVSPYLKNIAKEPCLRVFQLFERLTKPAYLLRNVEAYQNMFFLLEFFNNVIQYQAEGNQALIYSLVRGKETFDRLMNLDLFPEEPSVIGRNRKLDEESTPTPSKTSNDNTERKREWFWEWKARMPLGAIQRLIDALAGEIEAACRETEDADAVVAFLKSSTVVGLLPVPHAIVTRTYVANLYTRIWFSHFLWGVLFSRRPDFYPSWEKIRLLPLRK